ncbi:MAG: hypothetical protein ABSA79_09100 [Candidatus Bathyarchaeia archaeon]|jgi:hypothetical protein
MKASNLPDEGQLKELFFKLLVVNREKPEGVVVQDAINVFLVLRKLMMEDFPYNIQCKTLPDGTKTFIFGDRVKRRLQSLEPSEVNQEIAKWVERWLSGIQNKRTYYVMKPLKKAKGSPPETKGRL